MNKAGLLLLPLLLATSLASCNGSTAPHIRVPAAFPDTIYYAGSFAGTRASIEFPLVATGPLEKWQIKDLSFFRGPVQLKADVKELREIESYDDNRRYIVSLRVDIETSNNNAFSKCTVTLSSGWTYDFVVDLGFYNVGTDVVNLTRFNYEGYTSTTRQNADLSSFSVYSPASAFTISRPLAPKAHPFSSATFVPLSGGAVSYGSSLAIAAGSTTLFHLSPNRELSTPFPFFWNDIVPFPFKDKDGETYYQFPDVSANALKSSIELRLPSFSF